MRGKSKPCILCLIPHYLPGYRAGGPPRSVANLVAAMGDEYHFRIITSNRDFGTREAYGGIASGVWAKVGNADVIYLESGFGYADQLRKVVRTTPHEIRYHQSFFSPKFTVLPMAMARLGLVPSRPTIIAPRGEFADSALSIKRRRKRTFRVFSSVMQLYRNVIWQATSFHEKDDIVSALGGRTRVSVAPNLATMPTLAPPHVPREVGDPLRVIFLSRIARMKNLAFVLKVLATVRSKINLRIVGTIEDNAYWQECQKLVTQLPANVVVSSESGVPPDRVSQELAAHDVLFLPTLGENFGHVICEALAVGTPVLISDRTRWRALESQRVGWDLSLRNPGHYARVLDRLANRAPSEAAIQRAACVAFAGRETADAGALQAYRELFGSALDAKHVLTQSVSRISGAN